MDNLYFEIISKMGKRIRTTKTYWAINKKHPAMKGREKEVQELKKVSLYGKD
ncbi:hypothetical protein [Neomoorella thermoacetica]|uniref:hypothetical protein n=1 Tax=Neomoorella thermoacetica TaxID=1525 RepID=UPI0015A64AA7|nr:hypothetical protein [Moorella thermoacetica]